MNFGDDFSSRVGIEKAAWVLSSRDLGGKHVGLGPDRRLVLVVVIAVGGVAVAVVQVVHVVAVWEGNVAAIGAMGVGVVFVGVVGHDA